MRNILRRPGVWAITASLLLGGFAFAGSSAAEPGQQAPGQVRIVAAAPAAAADCDQQLSIQPSATASGSALARIRARGKLIAGIDTNSYLWGYRNPRNGELQGFDIDLVHELARAILGDQNAVQFLAVPTAQRIPALQSGLVDVVVRTFTITCERESQISFSAPYFETGQQVLVPGNSAVTGLNDSIKGARVCTASKSTAEKQLQDSPYKSQEVSVANQLDCLVLMQLGQVDATITDGALAAGQQAQDQTVKLVGAPLDAEFYGVAVKLGAGDLAARINQVLKDWEASGGWAASYRSNIGDVTHLTSLPPAAHYARTLP